MNARITICKFLIEMTERMNKSPQIEEMWSMLKTFQQQADCTPLNRSNTVDQLSSSAHEESRGNHLALK